MFRKVEIDKNEIGLMILVTQSPDYRRPSSASVIQNRLELPIDCSCMEINLGCSGFIYGLQTAMGLMNLSMELAAACSEAIGWLHSAIENGAGYSLGHGNGPVNHMFRIINQYSSR